MANVKISDFPQIYSDYPCKDCIALPMCLNKSELDIARCPYVKDFFYSNITDDRLHFVVNLDQFPNYRFLIGFKTSGMSGDDICIVARNDELNMNVIVE